MSGNDVYCDSSISVLIIVVYCRVLIGVMFAVVMNRDQILLFFVRVVTRRERFQGSVASENVLTRFHGELLLLLSSLQLSQYV